ncbi:MAG: YdcF family protein [Acidobacteriota bacterium]
MELFLRDVVAPLLLPPGGPLLLALIGWILHRTRWQRAGAICLGVGLCSLLLLSTPLMQSAVLATVDHHPPLVLDDSASWPAADAIVVLGAGVRWGSREWGDDVPGSVAVARLRYAAELHRRTGKPVLITGYTGDGMQRVMQHDLGTPVRWLEDRSYDTWENAANSTEMLRREGIDTIYLVTDFWHMPRALLAFRRTSHLRVVPAPMGFLGPRPDDGIFDRLRPGPGPLATANLVSHEWLGLLWYSVR